MRSPRRKPGVRHGKRVPGVVQRVHRTPREWREILARFRASGQSKFCEQNTIARSTFILWERRLASGDDGTTPACAVEWFVEVEDDGDDALRLAELRARQPGEGERELEVGLVTTGRIVMRVQGGWRC